MGAATYVGSDGKKHQERRTNGQPDVWKWVAGLLATILISIGGTYFATQGETLTTTNAPWVRDSAMVMLRIRTLENSSTRALDQIEAFRQRQEEMSATQRVILERINLLIQRSQ